MSTINELMQGKQPGEIRVTGRFWPEDYYFQPYFREKDEYWYGLNSDREAVEYGDSFTDFELWTPPPVQHSITVWMNVYPDGVTSSLSSRRRADMVADPHRVACVEVTFTYTDNQGIDL